ncbi:hypothetical protein K501DRAFT_247112 [Backusella circina FSU 941]|nr:hypothetical protein K501DRAFT_247112 [Backusella circina FSU 941]
MSEESSQFSTAIQFWKGVQLTTLQKELDQQGLTIVEHQKDGLVSRKKLAEQTREFKKIPDEEKIGHFKPLLKGYQAEIDNITRRTKYAENSFLTVYKLLADAPDPAPLFEAAIDQSARLVDNTTLENENKRINEKLEASKELTEALGKTNEELLKKIATLESSLSEKKEDEVKEQYNDRIRQYKEREHDLQKQLSQALDQLTVLRQTHDDTQAELINHNQKYDDEVVGKLAELDIVTMDLERANGIIIQLEKKNEDLKEENKQLKESVQEEGNAKSSSSPSEIPQQDAELTKLMKDVETYKDLLQKTETRLSKKVKDLTAETKSLVEEKEQLQKKMKNYDDYDEIKRELQIMKYVEFSTGDDDEDFDANTVLKKDESIQDSLEVRLMEKNKKLENEFTQVKVQYADMQAEFETKQKTIDTLTEKTNKQLELIHRLEEDLLRIEHKPTEDIADALAARTSLKFGTGSSTPRTPDGSSTPRLSTDTKSKDDKSILPIVMSQRDRFRQRNGELEERTRTLESTLQETRAEIQSLKTDNLKLYERLKFVHVWKEDQSKGLVNRPTVLNMDYAEPAASSSYRNFNKKSPKPAEDPADKYGRLYEESMNPFTQFHRKEENRRYNNLNPAEKLTLNLTRVLFSHKWSRYFFIIYSLLLHLLVVATLYQLSLWECRHDHEMINIPTGNEDALANILNNK